jgi:hypothetical protein
MRIRCLLTFAALAVAVPLKAADSDGVRLRGLLDMRAVRTDTTRSWLDGGLGKTRYGPPVGEARATLLRLSQVSLLVDAPLGDLLSAHVQVNADAEGDREVETGRVDLIQAFIDVKPEPSARLRLRARLGIFFPPVSQEADELAWTGPYTITPSAATSWIADELRILGIEGRVALRPEGHELALSAAALGGNDPTGSLLAWRGWSLGDRQTGVSDRLALAPIPSIEPGGLFEAAPRWVQPFREIDGRVGYYAAASYKKSGLADVRLIRYDNRADPGVFDGLQYAWHTRFSSAAAHLDVGPLELLGQYLDGRTTMGRDPVDGRPGVDNEFRTWFAMASVHAGRHRVSVRYDDFYVEDIDDFIAEDDNGETGHAWTAAYLLRIGEAHRLALEMVHVDSERPIRVALGLPAHQKETTFQASFRVGF